MNPKKLRKTEPGANGRGFGRNLLAQVTANTHVGGAGKLFKEFVLELAELEIPQLIVLRPKSELVTELKHPNIRIATAPFANPRLDFYSRVRLRRILDEAGPTVVISWLQRAAAFVPKSRKYKHLGRLDDYYSVKYYKSAHRIFAVSPPTAEHFIAQEPEIARKVEVIPNFTMPPQKPLKRLGDKSPTVAALGRFRTVKGYDLLIRATAELPGVNLLLAGEGKEEKNLRSLARSLGLARRVRFLPWQDDITDVLNQADILAMPSRREPFGLPFADGWSHKKAVVASKCAGPVSYIRHRHNGMLCEVGDVPTLKRAIAELLNHKALMRKVAENGHKEWLRKFSPSVIVKRWLEVLRDEGL